MIFFFFNGPLCNADLHSRDRVVMKPVLVINLEVKDNHKEAAIGALLTLFVPRGMSM